MSIMLPYIETLFIEVPRKNKTFLIRVIYRVSNTNVGMFNETLNNLIEPIRNNYEVIVVGDFNICLLNDDNRTQSFKNTLQLNSLFPTILEPTRVATVLRNGNYNVTQTLIDTKIMMPKYSNLSICVSFVIVNVIHKFFCLHT